MPTTCSRRRALFAVGFLLLPLFCYAQSTKMIYQFRGGTDGANPVSNLVDIGGKLYGTTSSGGGAANCSGGCGIVFATTPAGVETVVYTFKGGADGANPRAGLIDVGGILYGTTSNGGGAASCSAGCGTVFALSLSGNERVLHSFEGGSDGANPRAGLLNVGGTLFGTTTSGGGSANCTDGCGTVFTVTAAGTESVLYAFSGAPDGANPQASLIDVNGTLYGTTYYGGEWQGNDGDNCGSQHCGTVFAVTTAGSESIVHSFRGGIYSPHFSGRYPTASLIDVSGTLYTTTSSGGWLDGGVVFAVAPSGKSRVVATFDTRAGAPFYPLSGLVNLGGALYGTTNLGGSQDQACGYNGCGAVFEMTTAGSETVLHQFLHPATGFPTAGLLYIKARSAFFGTTSGGNSGYGGVFKLTP